jgi:hypothetical protein
MNGGEGEEEHACHTKRSHGRVEPAGGAITKAKRSLRVLIKRTQKTARLESLPGFVGLVTLTPGGASFLG